MSNKKGTIVDFFRDQIIKRGGKIFSDETKKIIQDFEKEYPGHKGKGKPYWYTYSKYIVKTWGRNSQQTDALKNLRASLGCDEENTQSGRPDTGLPIKSFNERDFTERFVVPYLEKEGHTITDCNTNRKGCFNTDIVSEKDGVTYYTEVKRDLGCHRLQTAIGQLFFEIFDNKKDTKAEIRYQIAFPEQYKGNRHFFYDLEQYLHDTLKIKVIFVKG